MVTTLRQAAIYSDLTERIVILPLGAPEPPGLMWSHGACFSSWQEASAEELVAGMFEVFAQLARESTIPVPRLHEAFCVIPEYRAYLPPEDPEALSDQEWIDLALLMDLPKSMKLRTDLCA